MRMTPLFLIIGSLLVFWSSAYLAVFLPAHTLVDRPSDIWRPWTKDEAEGNRLYVVNGCSYCHSMFIRTIDRGHGAERIAQPGDYYSHTPLILGTERTGPDLSMEGGQRPDDWHRAHFINPRHTSPMSVMPSWEFLGEDRIAKLTTFMQAMGGTIADARVERQKYWKQLAVEAYQSGPDGNIDWLHRQVPSVWRTMPNPYPASDAALQRGKLIYQQFCIGCHGPIGDGAGPAKPFLMPPPLNFTTLRRNLVDGKYIGGILYYQIMNGITGTSMPYFKRMLESEKIWDVSNYVAVTFIGYSDAGIEPKGIDAAYELEWRNPYPPPDTQPGPAPREGNP